MLVVVVMYSVTPYVCLKGDWNGLTLWEQLDAGISHPYFIPLLFSPPSRFDSRILYGMWCALYELIEIQTNGSHHDEGTIVFAVVVFVSLIPFNSSIIVVWYGGDNNRTLPPICPKGSLGHQPRNSS